MRDVNVGALPVCNGNKIVGMITDRDIVIQAIANDRDLNFAQVHEVMSSPIVYCFDDQNVRDVAQLMEQRRVRRVVVVDRKKKMVGILSISDLAIEDRFDRLAGEVIQKMYDMTQERAA